MILSILFPCLQIMTLFKEIGQLVVVQILGEVMNFTVWLYPTLCANIIKDTCYVTKNYWPSL